MPTDPNYLRDFSCLRALSEEQLEVIAQFTDAVCYPSSYTLFEEGKPGEHLYFLVKGDIEPSGLEIHVIGDAFQPRKALEAVWEGFEVGLKI
jgi:signal-transduction protein with cAMP-binding, CBS, and nucleotidyltransferase domain